MSALLPSVQAPDAPQDNISRHQAKAGTAVAVFLISCITDLSGGAARPYVTIQRRRTGYRPFDAVALDLSPNRIWRRLTL